MLENIVGQFLQSGAGADVLGQLKAQGVEGPAAQAAVTATAEGAMSQLSAPGAGGLGALVGGLLGGAAAPAAGGGALGALAGPVAQFVAQKTGLSPAIATMVVNAALPKLLAMIQGTDGGPAADAGAAPGLGNLLGGFLK